MIGVLGPLNNLCQAPLFYHTQNTLKNIIPHDKYYCNIIENYIIRTFDRSMIFGIAVETFKTTYFH
jgi:hypothetical protein